MKTKFRVSFYSPFLEQPKVGEYWAEDRQDALRKHRDEFYPDWDNMDSYGIGTTIEYIEGYADPTKTTRCTTCAAEFTSIEIEGKTCCPACGDKGVPCSISDDVTVKINWHELHLLCVWAENWANKIQADGDPRNANSLLTVMSIAGRLQAQHPDKNKLTLFSEVREVRKHIEETGKGNIVTNIDDDSKLGL